MYWHSTTEAVMSTREGRLSYGGEEVMIAEIRRLDRIIQDHQRILSNSLRQEMEGQQQITTYMSILMFILGYIMRL